MLKRVRTFIAKAIDMQDIFVFGGIGLVSYGLAQIYPPAAWVAAGAALFWLGVRN
jgi:hypothetical protein